MVRLIPGRERWSPAQIAAFEQQCGPMLDGVYRVQGDFWWNVYNPFHAGRVSDLCNRHQRSQAGSQPGRDNFWHSDATGASGNSDGQCSYIVRDHRVTTRARRKSWRSVCLPRAFSSGPSLISLL
jgi:hypothetical protein